MVWLYMRDVLTWMIVSNSSSSLYIWHYWFVYMILCCKLSYNDRLTFLLHVILVGLIIINWYMLEETNIV